jgi:hypothetical protein
MVQLGATWDAAAWLETGGNIPAHEKQSRHRLYWLEKRTTSVAQLVAVGTCAG